MKIIYSIAPYGTYCICLTNVHISNCYSPAEFGRILGERELDFKLFFFADS